MFTSSSEYYDDVDHLILNEAEITMPLFLKDIEDGKPKPKYTSEEWADVTTTPIPSWQLISTKKYTSMNIQYSRGCPFDCDFCDITVFVWQKTKNKK